MKIGALVPARIGSKRLPKKNIRLLGGKPLICWTVDALLEADIFSDVTVSTENDDIIEITRHYYCEKEVKILKRPSHFANDDSPLSLTENLYLTERPEIEWYGCFMATFPFRKPARFREAYNAIISRYPLKVTTISSKQYCSFDYYYPVTGGYKRFFEVPPVYASASVPVYNMHHRGCLPETWGRNGLTEHERNYLIYLDAEESLDIDTKADFEIAQKIADGMHYAERPLQQHELEDWFVTAPKEVRLSRLIALVGEDRLKDLSSPLLILENAHPTLSFFRIFEANARTYWISHEAFMYLKDDRFEKTGNSQHCPPHYKHSESYRFIRKFPHNKVTNFNIDSDLRGILYGHGTGHTPESIISEDRVILSEKLTAAGLPVNRYTFIEPPTKRKQSLACYN